jgi:hypothetical protein
MFLAVHRGSSGERASTRAVPSGVYVGQTIVVPMSPSQSRPIEQIKGNIHYPVQMLTSYDAQISPFIIMLGLRSPSMLLIAISDYYTP